MKSLGDFRFSVPIFVQLMSRNEIGFMFNYTAFPVMMPDGSKFTSDQTILNVRNLKIKKIVN